MWQRARAYIEENLLASAAVGTILGEAAWVIFRWLVRGLAEDRLFSGLNAWLDSHWSAEFIAWAAWTTLFVGAFVWWSGAWGGRPAFTSGATLYPDWPIRDLFLHVNPNVLEQPYLADWEIIGRRLLDYLSTGRLGAWGRVYMGSPEKTAKSSNQIKITQPYWEGADLTYLFFNDRFLEHTVPRTDSGLPAYADIQFNKAQVLGLDWPTREKPRMILLMEAARRAYEQTRGGIAAGMAEREGGPDQVITWFCWALWRHLTIYGMRPPSRQIERIGKGNKNTHDFVVEDGAVILKDRYGEARFADLAVTAEALEKAIEELKELG